MGIVKLSDNQRVALNRRVQGLSRELLKVQRAIADAISEDQSLHINDFGEDTYPVNTIVRFRKSFNGGQKYHNYVVVKIGPRATWVLAGLAGQFTWHELIEVAIDSASHLVFEALVPAPLAINHYEWKEIVRYGP
jgi:hypothetical protein